MSVCLFVCLSPVCVSTSFAWAKPSIEEIFLAASERRLLFPEDEREELDDMYTKLRTQQVRQARPHGCSRPGRRV